MVAAMDIIFCHGLESGPHGRKYHALVDAGIEVTSPDFQGMNLADRVDKLADILGQHSAPLLVGSSYGGITALCASVRHAASGGTIGGLLLLAPALARAEPPALTMTLAPPTGVAIIHGDRDQVVPVDVSRSFAARYPDLVTLVEVDDDHSLAASTELIVAATRALSTGAPFPAVAAS